MRFRGIGGRNKNRQGAIGIVFAAGTGVHGVRDQQAGDVDGGTFNDELRSATWRDANMILSIQHIFGDSVGVNRNSVEGHDSEVLRFAVEQDREIEVGNGRGVEYSPQLAFAGPHLDRGRWVVGVGNRNIINGKVFGGFAEAGAVVGRVSIAID